MERADNPQGLGNWVGLRAALGLLRLLLMCSHESADAMPTVATHAPTLHTVVLFLSRLHRVCLQSNNFWILLGEPHYSHIRC